MADGLKPKRLKKIIYGCIHQREKSQKQLYELFYGFGYAICRRYAASKEEAEEMVHNAFLNIFKYIGNYDEHRSFEAWIRKIFVNSAIDYYRKYALYNQLSTKDEPTENQAIITDEMLSGISAGEIMKLIERLPASYRVAVNLYIVEGYSHKEIADILHISEGTSKSNLARAKQKLATWLEQFEKV